MRELRVPAFHSVIPLIFRLRSPLQKCELDLPVRELRVLDSAFTAEGSAATLLVRDTCVLVCLEHVRVIITPRAIYAPVDAPEGSLQAHFLAHLEGLAILHAASDGSMELPGTSPMLPLRLR